MEATALVEKMGMRSRQAASLRALVAGPAMCERSAEWEIRCELDGIGFTTTFACSEHLSHACEQTDMARVYPVSERHWGEQHCAQREALDASIIRWGRETFPASSALSLAKHLVEEATELVAALQVEAETGATQPMRLHIEHELADVRILLVQIPPRLALDLDAATLGKMQINRRRIWSPPDADGIVRHVEGPDDGRDG